MAKPFSLQELEARVRALTRRGLGTASSVIRHGPLTLRRHRPRRLHQRADDRAVGARDRPARGAAAARRPPRQQGPAGRRACANGARRSATTPSRSTSTGCARRSSRARSASPPCAAWATAWRRSPHDLTPRRRPQAARGTPPRSPGSTPSSEPIRAAEDDARAQRSLFGEILDWMLAPLLLLWPMSVGADLAGGAGHRQPALRPRAGPARALRRARDARRPGRSSAASPAATTCAWPSPPRRCCAATTSTASGTRCAARSGELVGGDAELAAAGRRARAAPTRCSFATTPSTTTRCASPTCGCGTTAGANSASWCRWPRRFDKRSRLATEIIKGVILPQFVILPLAVLLVWFALARGIAPLQRAAAAHPPPRRASDLSPIDEHDVPEEVAPLVRSINDLLARLDQIDRRRRSTSSPTPRTR